VFPYLSDVETVEAILDLAGIPYKKIVMPVGDRVAIVPTTAGPAWYIQFTRTTSKLVAAHYGDGSPMLWGA
jgi:hypothetical protein